MNKRILIIGGVAGGASVAARARRLDAGAEIIMSVAHMCPFPTALFLIICRE